MWQYFTLIKLCLNRLLLWNKYLHSAELILFCFSLFQSIYPFTSPCQPFYGMSPLQNGCKYFSILPSTLSLQIIVKRDIWLWSKRDQSEAIMIFTIRANPSFRAVNLSIYLVFTAIVKLNVWSHLLNCVMCANMMFTFCANTIKVKKTLPLFRICYQCK